MASKRKATSTRSPKLTAKEEDKVPEPMQVDSDTNENVEESNGEKMEEKDNSEEVAGAGDSENGEMEEELEEEEEEEENGDEDVDEGIDEESSEDEEEEYFVKSKSDEKPAAKKPKTSKLATKAAVDATYLVTPTVPTYEMLVSAISSSGDRNGISIDGIKKYIKEHHPEKDWTKIKTHVKKALDKGLEDGTFIRPKKSENSTGLTGSFKINKESAGAKKLGAAKPKKESTTKEEKPKARGRPAKASTSAASAKLEGEKTAAKPKSTTGKKTEKEKGVTSKGKEAAAKTKETSAVKATAAKSAGKGTMKPPPKSPKQPPKSPKQPPKSPKQPPKSPKQPPKSPKRAAKSPKQPPKSPKQPASNQAAKSPKAARKAKVTK